MSAPTIKVLKKHGISAGSYKKIFCARPEERPKQVKKLIQLLADRTTDGRQRNLAEYHPYWAIDLAYEAPFQQITPTMIRDFLSHNWKDTTEAYKHFASWGIKESDIFIDTKTADGQPAKMLNPPFMYQVLVPIVKAYLTIRLAKIFNERDTNPMLPYTPLKLTPRNQVLCEVLTDIVNTISTWFGYSAVMREAIQQMLKYGVSLAFPRERWHEEYVIEEDGVDGKTGEPKYKEVVSKEGIRYVFPHPTRMFYDLHFPLTTFNSDTGCEYAAYWHILSYGEILDNPDYWNRNSVWFGTNWFSEPLYQNYFAEVFPCRLKFPEMPSAAGPNNRENKAAYYSTATRDRAIFITEFFIKINPRDWGLGLYEDAKLKKLAKTYNHPIWHRFVIAGDDTVIYAEPIPYSPIWFMGYDYDPQCARTSSFALETIPWQDQVTNILSQMNLTSKQNLANVTFYDKNVINSDAINSLKNSGSRQYVGLNFIEVDTMKMVRQGVTAERAFFPHKLEKQNLQELLQMMSTTLNIMERVLQITAQEAGSAASHQQSKAEVQMTGGASENRLALTSAGVDEGIDAWQRQLHDAWQSFGGSQIEAEISPEVEDLDKVLDELGFKVDHRSEDSVFISGNKSSLKHLRLESFARRNNGPQQAEDKELSQIIFSVVGTISGQPELFKRIGAKNLAALLEEGARLGGARKDFKLPLLKDGEDEEVPENVLQAIQKSQQAVLEEVKQKLAQPVAQKLAADDQQLEQMQQVLQQLQKIYEVASAQQDKVNIKKQETAAKLQLRAQESAATQRRKDAESQAGIARKARETQARVAIESQAAGAKAAVHATSKGHEAAVKSEVAKAAAEAKSLANKPSAD